MDQGLTCRFPRARTQNASITSPNARHPGELLLLEAVEVGDYGFDRLSGLRDERGTRGHADPHRRREHLPQHPAHEVAPIAAGVRGPACRLALRQRRLDTGAAV